MTTTSSSAPAQRPQIRKPGLISRLIMLPFHLLGLLCGALVLCIALECLGIHFLWPEQGWQHAQRMLGFELEQLSTDFTQSMVVQEPGRSARLLVEWVHGTLIEQSGLQNWVAQASSKARAGSLSQTRDFRYYVGVVYVHLETYLTAAAYMVLVFLVRTVVLCLSLPLFGMAAFVGLVDGLVRRDVRRFGAGRESGFIYHRARASLIPLIVLPWMLYLVLPFSLNPLFVLLPCALLLSVAVNITAGSFKKYL